MAKKLYVYVKKAPVLTAIANISALLSVYYAYQTVSLSKESGRPFVATSVSTFKNAPQVIGVRFSLRNVGQRPIIESWGTLYSADISGAGRIYQKIDYQTGNSIVPNDIFTVATEIRLNREGSRFSSILVLVINYKDYISADKEYSQTIVYKIPDTHGGKKIQLAYGEDYYKAIQLLRQE